MESCLTRIELTNLLHTEVAVPVDSDAKPQDTPGVDNSTERTMSEILKKKNGMFGGWRNKRAFDRLLTGYLAA